MKKESAKKRKPVIHRVGTAHRNRIDIKIKEVKKYVMENLQVGGKLAAPHDAYNMDNERTKIYTERTVLEFYPNVILTVDDYGKMETYQYFDVFKLIKGKMKHGA